MHEAENESSDGFPPANHKVQPGVCWDKALGTPAQSAFQQFVLERKIYIKSGSPFNGWV